ALRIWAQASTVIGASFNQSQKSCLGVSRGYILPDPILFANHRNKTLRQAYFTTYLRLRPVLLYYIRTLGVTRCLMSSSEWRNILGLELHGSRNDTKAAESCCQIQADIQASLNSAGSLGIHLNNLGSIAPTWNNTVYEPRQIPQNVCRQILWEIYTISFRFELLILDGYLYE
ncbi:hypothetical protein CPB85DRAFT_1169993, partial [Mucidula mucida]